MAEAMEVTVEIPRTWARNLTALVDPEQGMESLADILLELADHAQQAVYRPGSWERAWLVQAFGPAFIDRLEPDPDAPDIFQRPRPDTASPPPRP